MPAGPFGGVEMIGLLRKVLFAIAAVLMAAMVGSLFLQVVAREFHWSVDWTEESARFTFIAMVFMATVYATMTGSHLRVSVFSDLLAGKLGTRAVTAFHALVVTGFSAVMVWYSGYNFIDGFRYPNISPAIGFNQNILFIFMTVGFAVNTLLHALEFAQSLLPPRETRS